MVRLKYALTEEKGERDMSDSKRRLWTIPNVLTLIRLILVPVYWVLMLGYHLDYWALGAFLLASATDMLDGFLARRMQCITDFGKLMDPLADKLMVLSVLFTLLIRGIIPWEPVALLGGTEGVIEVRTLFGPAGDLVQLVMAVCPGGQNAEHQHRKKQTTHKDSCQSATIVRVGRRICREVLSVT